MKKKTLQLFQLLLAVFGFYAAYMFSGPQKTFVPLLCLVLLFLLDKIETTVHEEEKEPDKEEVKHLAQAQKYQESPKQLELLLYSKSIVPLKDALQGLLRELGFTVKTPQDQHDIDRILSIDTIPSEIALKVTGDTSDISEDWNQWKNLKNYADSRPEKDSIVLLLANNWNKEDGEQKGFNEFSQKNAELLAAKKIVAMTTLTFYKIYRLCMEKNQNPTDFFKLICRHRGGVFKLEDYAKKQAT